MGGLHRIHHLVNDQQAEFETDVVGRQDFLTRDRPNPPVLPGLPGFIRLGVTLIAALYRPLVAVPGGWWLAGRLVERPLPLLGEYPRLVRSLGYAYIWERWPDTPADAR